MFPFFFFLVSQHQNKTIMTIFMGVTISKLVLPFFLAPIVQNKSLQVVIHVCNSCFCVRQPEVPITGKGFLVLLAVIMI